MIAVDASVAAQWLFAEEHSTQADELLRAALQRAEPLVTPPLLPIEVANIIRQRLRRRQLQLGAARTLLAQFLAVPISLQVPQGLYDRALVLADEYALPAIYDAHYVALAELLKVELWTADQRLLRTLGNRLPLVRWIADYHG